MEANRCSRLRDAECRWISHTVRLKTNKTIRRTMSFFTALAEITLGFPHPIWIMLKTYNLFKVRTCLLEATLTVQALINQRAIEIGNRITRVLLNNLIRQLQSCLKIFLRSSLAVFHCIGYN